MQRRLTRAMVRDAVVVAVVAVLTFQAARRWFGDRYLVPTGSMEPVLHGDPEHGDVVFVRKGIAADRLARHDLVVVQHPNDPRQQLVKRIAARGDDDRCWINIRFGDLWLGDHQDRLTREQKEPRQARALRVTWADAGTATGDAVLTLPPRDAAGSWTMPPAVGTVDAARRIAAADTRAARRGEAIVPPAGFFGARRPVDAGYVDATGARGRTGNDVPVRDVGMAVTIERAGGDVFAAIDGRNETLAFHWQPAAGRVALWRDGEDVAVATWPVLGATEPAHVEFGLLDDRAFFLLRDRDDATFVVARRPEWDVDPEVAGRGPRTIVWIGAIGAAGTAPLVVGSLRVFHDVHFEKEPIVGAPGQPGSWPRFVERGHWFLLGDNAFDSRDSRHFGAVPAASFVGVPCCVLGPWPRTRWITP